MNFETATAIAAQDMPVPYGARLLAGWYATGRPADLSDHLARYGPAPIDGAPGALADAVEQAGLTGRGGGAFPTGRKLRAVAGRRGPAVVVANGMESEPASRKDETLLDLAPHLVLDGAVLAASATGATVAHVCLPRTRADQAESLSRATEERHRAGLDPVEIRVHTLPHHFVSSEETALVSWLNGGGAHPRSTPPRPFEKGVGKRPTFIANVETLAHMALIARYGPGWFRELGSESAPGTTLVTLSGAVRHPGVYEIPMGGSARQALATAGGPTERLGAVLAGGFFGSWLPMPLDPVAQPRGAGVLVALPEDTCGLAETAGVLAYLGSQSARQCGPCMFGIPSVADDFAELAWGQPDTALLDRLNGRLGLLPGRGACRHPDGAARLATSALLAFGEEVVRHMQYGPCSRAGGPLRLPIPAGPPAAEEGWR
ncbi:NADH-ubiquinone oxidoreductase-F iron-sulfur binding region domain-containing protein [Actinacidiphila rubida]|uniref:NADH:ubiquinone oxidoreductase, NADH-binding subunit (Chain F) n=1 Tax=Actinacidiphila rubida TaxID=310780 RepID=A0A1H8SI36_9ACTN|nr:NADH-ubiquinone oxidoreductase-F iron-sulfur binding region domain-containing protein [Actinacidiphila rubida]SEO78679.1 NADH:ubiquinone oxidoreductase, NADH-binding subunit (chain F) [Actinacidiphila rubida]